MTQVLERPGAPAPSPVDRPKRPRRRWPHRLIPVALLGLGILVLIYPVGATFYNNYKQHEFARQYGNQVKAVPSTDLSADLAGAAAYNQALDPGALKDPLDPTNAEQSAAYTAYLGELDRFPAMARIRIPSIKADLPVFHGTSDETLGRGVGHLFGSSLPVGGLGTHAVLTGHSSLANATLFDRLADVSVGDRFLIEVSGRTLAYEVDQIQTVLPDQLDSLSRVDGMDYVTLITCTPYAVNSHRLLVRGHAVPYVAQTDAVNESPLGFDWTIQSWMWPRILGAVLAVGLLLAMIVGWVRSDRKRKRKRLAQEAQAAAEAATTAAATPTLPDHT